MKLLLSAGLLVLGASGPAFAQGKYTDEGAGWSVEIPKGWKHGEQGGRVLIGSDTEAGLMVAWYDESSSYEDLQREAKKGIQEEGVSLSPAGPAKPFESSAGRALQVSLRGRAQDGTELAALVIGVTRGQGAVGLLALTTPEQIAGLEKRLYNLAGSLRFFAPKLGDVAKLQGPLCTYSGGSGYSSTSRMFFDGKGRASFGSEFIASGDFKDGQGNYAGGWGTTSGNQHQAKDVGTYRIKGSRVEVRFPERSYDCQVHFKQSDGRITELQCGDKLWGRGLCE